MPRWLTSAVLELFHHPDFGIGLRPVALVLAHLFRVVVAVLRHLRAVVHVEPLRVDAGRAHELHLLGLLIVQRGGPRQGVEMKFVK